MTQYGPAKPVVLRETTFAWRYRVLLILGTIVGSMVLGAAVVRWTLLPLMAGSDWQDRARQAEVICEQMLDAKMAELSEQYPDSISSRGSGRGPGSFEVDGGVCDQDVCYLNIAVITPELKPYQIVHPDVLIIIFGGKHTREFAWDLRRKLRTVPVDVRLIETP